MDEEILTLKPSEDQPMPKPKKAKTRKAVRLGASVTQAKLDALLDRVGIDPTTFEEPR